MSTPMLGSHLGVDKATFLRKANTFVAKIVDLEFPDREVSRLCKAWEGTQVAVLAEESSKAKAAEAIRVAKLAKAKAEEQQAELAAKHS